MQRKNHLTGLATLLVFVFSLVAPMVFVNKAEAANLQRTIVRFDRLAASTVTSGQVCAQPQTTSAVNVDVQVTFPTGFTVSTTAGNWAATTANILSGSTAWPGITTATATVSSQTVTWTYSGNQTLTAGTLYCFIWTNTAALTTGTAGNDKVGSVTTRTTAAATIDSGSYATSIVSNDQIVVTATVPSTFTFTLPVNTDTFTTNLGTTTVSTNGRTATIATNAASGWVAWVKSANAALNSVSTGATIATAGSVDNTPSDLASVTGYVLDVNYTDSATGTGTITQAANFGQEYAGGNNSDTVGGTAGGALSTTFQPIAASSGTTDGDSLVLVERAKISAVQAAAADYTDTLTVVAAGRF